MAKLGNYEIVRRIHHEDPVTVWTARPADAEPDTPARYIIKSCQPFVTISGQLHQSDEVGRFIDAVQVQNKVCEAGARHWAPIHQAREVTGGAFYVSDYYGYSAERLMGIEGWLNAASLHQLVSSVVAGLLELKKFCGRPHGNLKPTNIQVASDGDLARARVVLTDPLPGAALDPAAAAADDLRAIGHLIYQLIFHRPFRVVSGWPLPASKRWDVLGGKAHAWRELSSRLLDPNLNPSELTIERLAQEVAALRARWTPRAKVAAVAALVVVLGGAAALYLTRRGGPPPPVKPTTSDRPAVVDDRGWSEDDARAWRELCYAFDDWFAAFHREVSRSKWRRDEWRGDPALAAIVKRVEEADLKSLDPRTIAGDTEAPFTDLAEDPPAAAKTPAGIARTKRAHQTVAALTQAVTRGPLIGSATVRELAEAFRARGWAKPAERLDALADGLKPRKWAPIAIALDETLGAARKLRTVEDVHKKLQERIEADPGGAADRIGAYLEEQTAAAEDIDSLLTALKVVERFADIVAAGAEGMQSVEKRIRDAGGEELAKKFVQCVSARWKDLTSSAARDQMLDGARKAASQIETRLSQIDAHYEAVKELGQQVADDHKALLRGSVRDAQDLDALLRGIGTAAALAKAIDDKWAVVRAAARPLEESADPILKAFRSAVVAEVKATRDLEGLPERLAELKTFASHLERAAVDEKIDHALFLKGRTVRPNPDGSVDRGILVAWLEEVDGYRRLPPLADPRLPKEAWAAELKDVGFHIQFLKDFGKPDEVKRGAECAVALAAARAAIADMRALAWVKKNERTIRSRAMQNKAALETLRKKVGQPTGALAQGLNAIRALAAVATSPTLNQEWVKRRNALVPANVTAQQVKATPRRYGTLWRDVQTLRDFLAGLDDPAELPKGPPELAKDVPAGDVRRTILAELSKKREQAIAKALASVPWRADGAPQAGLAQFRRSEAWTKARDAYRQWRDDAGRLLADAHKIHSLLTLGDLRDVRFSKARQTVRDLHAECVDKPIYKEFRDLLRPIAERVAKLVPIETLGKDQLVARGTELLGRPKEKLSPEDVRLVWATLGDKVRDWPGSVDDLSFDLELQREIREGAARLAAADAARAEELRKEVARDGPGRWERVFNKAIARVAPNDLADAQVAAVVELLKAAAVRPDALDPMTRFRLLLRRLRRTAGALPDDGWTDENQEQVAEFQRAVRALPAAFAQRPEVRPFLGGLREFLERKKPAAPSGDLTKAGPAASLLPAAAAACKTAVGPDARSASYQLTVRPPGTREETHALAFVRVSPAEGQAAAYLCTTEVSVALFSAVLAAAGKTKEEVEALVQWERVSGARGPRTWRIRRGRVDRNLLWLAALPGVKTYAAELTVPRPTTAHPMHYLSPEAALYVARLLGCRLPTSTEWQAAYQPGGEANLRDNTSWLKQRDYILNLQKRYKPSWPDTDVFLPKGAATVKREGAAQPVPGASDKWLWFSPVGSGGAFQHLAGNVAEFVYDAPVPFNAAFKQPASLSAARLRSFLDEGAAHLKVVGASALSPPELWNGADKPFATAWPADLARARRGYSDVGFRLAFTAPGDPVARRLKNLLKRWGYLTKAP